MLLYGCIRDFIRNSLFVFAETIIYDTIGLLPEHGKAKELDIRIIDELKEIFTFEEDTISLYEKLWEAHNDVSHLTPKQLLLKDLKIIENIPVPGLPMLAADFLKLKQSYETIKELVLEYNTSFMLLIGLDAASEVKRDVALFFKEKSIALKENLLEKMYNSQQLKGYNFEFSEVYTGFDDIVCLRQFNIKLSRKQIIPLLKDCLLEHEASIYKNTK